MAAAREAVCTEEFRCSRGDVIRGIKRSKRFADGEGFDPDYTSHEIEWWVPPGVTTVTIEAIGAQGGDGTYGPKGGVGARVRGTYAVVPNTALYLTVGAAGESQFDNFGCGGGGSWVRAAAAADWPLLVAGGGGGGAYVNDSEDLHFEDDRPWDGEGWQGKAASLDEGHEIH